MMTPIDSAQDKFCKFFAEFGELCFQIGNVERPLNVFDFTQERGQAINPDYFIELKKKFPKTLLGFYIALGKNNYSINCYLQENGNVLVEFCNKENVIEKVICYVTTKHLKDSKTGLIHYLTKEWRPF